MKNLLEQPTYLVDSPSIFHRLYIASSYSKDAGATTVFLPSEKEIYPGEVARIDAGAVGELYEGASRNGHFSGVLTVVKRLFDLVKPKHAIFGEKDFQQLFLIKEMVEKLQIPVNIVSAPTIRDVNKLALSTNI